MIYKQENLFGKVIRIGKETENNFRSIEFDVTTWRTAYPTATFGIIYQMPGGVETVPAVSLSGNILTWVPTREDTATEGTGTAQLSIINASGDIVGRSDAFTVMVEHGLATGSAPPATAPSWVETVITATETATEAAETAAEAVDTITGLVATHEADPDAHASLFTAKQDALTFDDAPAAGSVNPVKSGGIKTALDAAISAAVDPVTSQLAAIASVCGVTSDKVGELKSAINIIENLETNKYLDQTVSGTTMKTVNVDLKAEETYNISWDSITTEDTASTVSRIQWNYSDGTHYAQTYERGAYDSTFTPTKDVVSAYFYASNGYNNSVGKAFSFNNVKITKDSVLKQTIDSKISMVETESIGDGAVTQEKTDFLLARHGKNLLDYTTMVTDLAWAYTSNPSGGGIVSIVSNQYTNTYSAAKIPLPSTANKISMQSSVSCTLYSYYFTDADSATLSYEYNVSYNLSGGKTLTVPSGAVYLYLTFKNIHSFTNADLMVSATDSPIAYEEYETYYEIEGLKVEGSGGGNAYDESDVLKTPEKFDLIVGDTFEMFKESVLNVYNADNYDIEFVGDNLGKAWDRKYEYTPVAGDIGNHNYTVRVRNNIGEIVDSASMTLKVHAQPTSPSSEKVILCVGDSLTQGGQWPKELRRRLIGSGGTPDGYNLANITFIGTKELEDGTKYEGYGGWSFSSYLSSMTSNDFMNISGTFDKTDDDQHSVWEDANGSKWKLETITSSTIKIIRQTGSTVLPSSGTLTWVSGGVHTGTITYASSAQAPGNPFWDASQNKNNFTAYMTRIGVSKIDHMIILLGWNNSGTSEETYKGYVTTFIDQVFAEIPNCKITLLGLQRLSRDGCANNYGTSWKYMQKLAFVWDLNQWYQDVADEYTNGNVEFVNIAGQFDTQYCCATMSQQVNTRTNTTITVQSNGVHPATNGYYQIADAVLRNLAGKLN